MRNPTLCNNAAGGLSLVGSEVPRLRDPVCATRSDDASYCRSRLNLQGSRRSRDERSGVCLMPDVPVVPAFPMPNLLSSSDIDGQSEI